VELKKRGVAIREAFNQVHRCSKEKFNSEHSLFRFLQLFVISNGTDMAMLADEPCTMNWMEFAEEDRRETKEAKAELTKLYEQHRHRSGRDHEQEPAGTHSVI
jgi:type I restriction enzyme, R subunit